MKYVGTIVANMYVFTILWPGIIPLSVLECFKIKLFQERLKREEKQKKH